MTQTSNVNTSTNKTHTPAIICIAESTHYLVGVLDEKNNLTAINASNKITTKNSLTEAKNYLRENHIFSAVLEYHTAYDEMCGLSQPAPCRQNIRF